jgi:methylenetetrahydrofolate--tRNA-(uracil-5-)-methyltransferase
VYLAGQISGVEGYVESAAGGFLCSVLLAQTLHGLPFTPPPVNTALGGIRTHLARKVDNYQPSNITWACLPPHETRKMKKRDRYTALAERALAALDAWLVTAPLARVGVTGPFEALAPSGHTAPLADGVVACALP